jgi:adenylate kinase
LGRIAGEYAQRGELVPDEVTISMMRRRLERPDVREGFVLDGFPRNLVQARALDEILDASGMSLDHAVHLHVDDAEIHRRLSRRAHLEGRTDDAKREVIENRIDTYRRETQPCLAYYAQRGIAREVDGGGSEDEVFERIRRAIGSIERLRTSIKRNRTVEAVRRGSPQKGDYHADQRCYDAESRGYFE